MEKLGLATGVSQTADSIEIIAHFPSLTDVMRALESLSMGCIGRNNKCTLSDEGSNPMGGNRGMRSESKNKLIYISFQRF